MTLWGVLQVRAGRWWKEVFLVGKLKWVIRVLTGFGGEEGERGADILKWVLVGDWMEMSRRG